MFAFLRGLNGSLVWLCIMVGSLVIYDSVGSCGGGAGSLFGV